MTKAKKKSITDMVELCLTGLSQLASTVETMQKTQTTAGTTKATTKKGDSGKSGEFTSHVCVYSDPVASKDNDFMEFKIRDNKYPEFADGVYPKKAIHVNQLVKEGKIQSVGITVWNGNKARRVSCYVPVTEILAVIQQIEKEAL